MAKDKAEKTMRLSFRKSVTLPGGDGEPVQHAAGTVDTCPCTDEAWDCVNRGDADLNPPPGVDGQPTPDEFPDRLKRTAATEVPLPPAPAVPTAAVMTMTPKEVEKARREQEQAAEEAERRAHGHGHKK